MVDDINLTVSHHLLLIILGLQPIPGDPKDNGMAAMLDAKTKRSVIQHATIVFLISRDWLQTKNRSKTFSKANNWLRKLN